MSFAYWHSLPGVKIRKAPLAVFGLIFAVTTVHQTLSYKGKWRKDRPSTLNGKWEKDTAIMAKDQLADPIFGPIKDQLH